MSQPNLRLKTGVINTTGSQLANVVSNGVLQVNQYVFMDGTGGNIAIFPPIPKGSIINIEKKVAQIEKSQVVVVMNHKETPNATVGALTRYSVGIQSPKDRIANSNTRDTKIFAAVLASTGVAATDRATIVNNLVAKLNAYIPLYTKAQALQLYVATGLAALTAGNVPVGCLLGQGAVGATWMGYCCYADSTWTTAAGQGILVHTISGTLGTGIMNNISTGSDVALTSGVGAITTSQGLSLYDQSGYFSWKDKIGRGGAPFIYSSPTFTSIRPTIVQQEQTSHGLGTDMIAEIAEFDLNRIAVDKGNILRQWNQLPLAGSSYTEYIIRFRSKTSPGALDGSVVDIPAEYSMYLKEDTAPTWFAVGIPNATTDAGILALT